MATVANNQAPRKAGWSESESTAYWGTSKLPPWEHFAPGSRERWRAFVATARAWLIDQRAALEYEREMLEAEERRAALEEERRAKQRTTPQARPATSRRAQHRERKPASSTSKPASSASASTSSSPTASSASSDDASGDGDPDPDGATDSAARDSAHARDADRGQGAKGVEGAEEKPGAGDGDDGNAADCEPLEEPSSDESSGEEPDAGGEGKRKKPPITFRIAEAFDREHQIALDADGIAYVRLDGIAHRLRDSLGRRAIAQTCLRLGVVPRRDVIDQVIACLESGPNRGRVEPRLRVGAYGDTLWIDCGPCFVRVDARGWELRPASPIWFRRPTGWRPLPTPEHGDAASALAELRELLGLDGDDWTLAVAWLVGVLRPHGPYAILNLVGEQGVGKSVRAAMLRSLVDPNQVELEIKPKSVDDLIVGATNALVIAIDNLSALSEDLSDALCQLATGGGIRKRRLYTDAEVAIVSLQRALILCGISEIDRGDLASRSLRIELAPLTARRTEATMRERLAAIAPRVLGALLDAVSCAMRRLPEAKLTGDDIPRLADFATWASASEPALGLPDGAVLAAMRRAAERGAEERAEGSPLAVLLGELTKSARNGEWVATPSDTLTMMRRELEIDRAPIMREGIWGAPEKVDPNWKLPASPRALGAMLRRAAPDLRMLGFEIDLDAHDGRDQGKKRVYRIHRVPAAQEKVPRGG